MLKGRSDFDLDGVGLPVHRLLYGHSWSQSPARKSIWLGLILISVPPPSLLNWSLVALYRNAVRASCILFCSAGSRRATIAAAIPSLIISALSVNSGLVFLPTRAGRRLSASHSRNSEM